MDDGYARGGLRTRWGRRRALPLRLLLACLGAVFASLPTTTEFRSGGLASAASARHTACEHGISSSMCRMTIRIGWWSAAALGLLLVACGVGGTPGCTTSESGSSPMFGRQQQPNDRYVDHTPSFKQFGDPTKFNLYFSYGAGCLVGIKATYGYDAANAQLMGVEKNMYTVDLRLAAGEAVRVVEFKEGPKCIEYLRLNTTKGRHLGVGLPNSATPTTTVTANRDVSRLGPLRGYVGADGGLRRLQLVWVAVDCPGGAPPAQPRRESASAPSQRAASRPPSGSPKPTPAPAAAPAPPTFPAPAADQPASEAPAPKRGPPPPSPQQQREPAQPRAAVPAELPPAAAPKGAQQPPKQLQRLCKPKPVLCSPDAPKDALGHCDAKAPYYAAKACVGGCCWSSGKCATSSCLVNGLGKDVAWMPCFGSNVLPDPLLILGNKCANLLCRLAVPGCKNKQLLELPGGGSCVGTVEAAEGAQQHALHPVGRQFLGFPCVEIGPEPELLGGKVPLLNSKGNNLTAPLLSASEQGRYVAGAWKVCDCEDSFLPRMELPQLPPLSELPKLDLAPLLPKLELPQLLPKLDLPPLPKLDLPQLLPKLDLPPLSQLQLPQLPDLGLPRLPQLRDLGLPPLPGQDDRAPFDLDLSSLIGHVATLDPSVKLDHVAKLAEAAAAAQQRLGLSAPDLGSVFGSLAAALPALGGPAAAAGDSDAGGPGPAAAAGAGLDLSTIAALLQGLPKMDATQLGALVEQAVQLAGLGPAGDGGAPQ